MKQRDIKKLERIAKERGGGAENRPNKLAQIERKAKRQVRTKGRTVLIKNNEFIWTRKKEEG